MKSLNKFARSSMLLLGLLIFSCAEEKTSSVAEIIRPVKYAKVSMSGDAFDETFSGSSQSSKESNVSFRVGGTITRLNVKLGDVVRKGQVIANIDQTDYSVQYEQSIANDKSTETQIESAKSQLVSNQATYQRVEKLYANNSVSISDFEAAKSALEVARASYNAAVAQANASKMQVESAHNQVRYSTLLAPFSGVITDILVEENESVGSGTPIATVSDINNPEISVGIPEIFISKIKKGESVRITFSTIPDQDFTGSVYEVGFSSLGGSTYPVTIRIDKPTKEIRPGMAADVQFSFSNQKDETERMFTPIASVGEDNNGHFVFGLVEDGENYLAKKKVIEIGDLTPRGFEVKSGLTSGELIAVAGLDNLLDGMKVRLMD